MKEPENEENGRGKREKGKGKREKGKGKREKGKAYDLFLVILEILRSEGEEEQQNEIERKKRRTERDNQR